MTKLDDIISRYSENEKITISVPTSWQDITLKQFEELQKVSSNDIDGENRIMSILCNIDLDVIESMSFLEFRNIQSKLSFINEPPKPCIPAEKLIVNDRVIKVILNPAQMTAAQFFDYQNYMSNNVDKKTAKLCSCFMIPDGYNYNDEYDSVEWIDFLHNNLSVVEVQSYTHFFMITYKAFAESFLQYSIKEVKKMKHLTKEEKKVIMKGLKETKHLIKSGGFSL